MGGCGCDHNTMIDYVPITLAKYERDVDTELAEELEWKKQQESEMVFVSPIKENKHIYRKVEMRNKRFKQKFK